MTIPGSIDRKSSVFGERIHLNGISRFKTCKNQFEAKNIRWTSSADNVITETIIFYEVFEFYIWEYQFAQLFSPEPRRVRILLLFHLKPNFLHIIVFKFKARSVFYRLKLLLYLRGSGGPYIRMIYWSYLVSESIIILKIYLQFGCSQFIRAMKIYALQRTDAESQLGIL